MIKKMINKKGALSDADKLLFWVIFVIPACGLMIMLVFIAMPQLIEAQTTVSPSLQRHIAISTVLGSPLCFAYEEQITNRVYNGYVDLEKFTQKNLNDCMRLETRTDQGFFVAAYSEGEFLKEIETRNVLNRVSARSIEITRPVIIVDGDTKSNGYLRFIFYW